MPHVCEVRVSLLHTFLFIDHALWLKQAPAQVLQMNVSHTDVTITVFLALPPRCGSKGVCFLEEARLCKLKRRIFNVCWCFDFSCVFDPLACQDNLSKKDATITASTPVAPNVKCVTCCTTRLPSNLRLGGVCIRRLSDRSVLLPHSCTVTESLCKSQNSHLNYCSQVSKLVPRSKEWIVLSWMKQLIVSSANVPSFCWAFELKYQCGWDTSVYDELVA